MSTETTTVEITETIKTAAAECRAEARGQGWEGEDDDFNYSPVDMDYIVSKAGRLPTREEWTAAGFGWVGGAHCAE